MKRFTFMMAILFSLLCLSPTALAATEAELQQQKDQAAQQAAAAQYQIDMTQTTMDGIAAEIEKANAAIAAIGTQVDEKNAQIEALTANLAELEAALDTAKTTLSQEQQGLEERVRVMYMYGSSSYAEFLFSADSLSDLMTKADMVASVMKADQHAVAVVQSAMDEVSEKTTALNNEKKTIETAKAESVALLNSQEGIKAQQNELLAKNSDVLETAKAELEARNAEMAAAENELASLAASNSGTVTPDQSGDSGSAGDNASSGEENTGGGSSGGGATATGYIWPTDSHYISDYFGERESPGGIGSTNHMGLDIGAGSGAPIYASAAGRVIYAAPRGGYGNCVMIAHDDGYTTLYAHQSEIAVSEGQWVSQGQVIGYVGSTGDSTGPHLHISFITPGGNFVDPLNFIS